MGGFFVLNEIKNEKKLVRFNPLDKRYKSTIGVMTLGKSISFMIDVEESIKAKAVYMLLAKAGEVPIRYELEKLEKGTYKSEGSELCTLDGEYNQYTVNTSVDSSGIYFYKFEIKAKGGVLQVGAGHRLIAEENSTNAWQLTVVENKKVKHPIKDGILYFIKTGDGTRLSNTVIEYINNYPKVILESAFIMIKLHDATKLKLASVLAYTLPGVPKVDFLSELKNGKKDFMKHFRNLSKIRLDYKDIFSNYEFEFLCDTNGVFAFERKARKKSNGRETEELITIIVNNSQEDYGFCLGKGCIDLLSGERFKGVVKAGEAVILKNRDNN